MSKNFSACVAREDKALGYTDPVVMRLSPVTGHIRYAWLVN